jgi:hypothetical protein
VTSIEAFGAVGAGRMAVPGSLRGYRYFTLNILGEITSVVFRNHLWTSPRFCTSQCNLYVAGNVKPKSSYFCASCAKVYDSPRVWGLEYDRYVDTKTPVTVEMVCDCDFLRAVINNPWKALPRIKSFQASLTLRRFHSESAPSHNCRCGYYAGYTIESLRGAPGCSGLDLPLVGVVEAAGKVVLADRGFRAEKMRVVAVTRAYPEVGDIPSAAKLPSDIAYFSTIEKMVDAYPPEDVRELLK